MADNFNDTMLFKTEKDDAKNIRSILKEVYRALENKGYKPTNQIIGYILSGDPTYITSHDGARKLIRQVDRDEILEELLNYYIGKDNE